MKYGTNELIFIIQSCIISIAALAALQFGKNCLITFTSLLCVMANLFVVKQITLFGLPVTPADPYTIGVIMNVNLLNEYFGKAAARQGIVISFISMVLFGILAELHLWYIPSSFDLTHGAFATILGSSCRIIAASLAAYIISQSFEYRLYSYLKNHFAEQHLVIRNIITMSSTQLLDTMLFSFLGLYGIVHSIWPIIFMSYTIKLIAIAMTTPFLALSKKLPLPKKHQS